MVPPRGGPGEGALARLHAGRGSSPLPPEAASLPWPFSPSIRHLLGGVSEQWCYCSPIPTWQITGPLPRALRAGTPHAGAGSPGSEHLPGSSGSAVSAGAQVFPDRLQGPRGRQREPALGRTSLWRAVLTRPSLPRLLCSRAKLSPLSWTGLSWAISGCLISLQAKMLVERSPRSTFLPK